MEGKLMGAHKMIRSLHVLKYLLFFLPVYAIIIYHKNAHAQLFSPPPYGSTIELVINDNASNGCWTNISETKLYLKDKLSRLGYDVREARSEARTSAGVVRTETKPEADAIVVLEIIGDRTNRSCWGVADISLQFRTPLFRNDVSRYVLNGNIKMTGIFENNLNMTALQIVEYFSEHFVR